MTICILSFDKSIGSDLPQITMFSFFPQTHNPPALIFHMLVLLEYATRYSSELTFQRHTNQIALYLYLTFKEII